ncbi:MAG: aspartate 1-decarboxylase [Chitinivibrionales bacterium]|nr:aspartate 1-decarboxylase [Chitinivibrionales bacterium]
MFRRFLGSKIQGLRITGLNLEYEGSITLDERYIAAAGILPGEAVDVLSLENDNRFTTYVIKGARGSGVVELNGPAARLGLKGDRIMVLTYVMLSPEEIAAHKPTVVRAADIAKS